MKLENQVVSLELAKKLKELGFKQESLFYYSSPAYYPKGHALEYKNKTQDLLFQPNSLPSGGCSAYTSLELGYILPDSISYKENDLDWQLCISKNVFKEGCEWDVSYLEPRKNIDFISYNDKNLSNAMAKMLIYLKENNLI